MGIFFKSNFQRWLETASDKELSDGYEKRRLAMLKAGAWEKTPEMKAIDREMCRRSSEKWEKDPRRNRDPNYRWTDENRWDKD